MSSWGIGTGTKNPPNLSSTIRLQHPPRKDENKQIKEDEGSDKDLPVELVIFKEVVDEDVFDRSKYAEKDKGKKGLNPNILL